MSYIRHDSSVWQALEGVAAGVACQYGGEIQPCGFCGLGVYQMVAGVESVFLGDTEICQGFQQSFRVRLVGGYLLAAYDMVYQMLAMGSLELFLYAAGGLAGHDADFGAVFPEFLQGWQGFGVEVGTGGHIAVGYFSVGMAEAVDEVFVLGVQGYAHSFIHGQADKASQVLVVFPGEAHSCHGLVEAFDDDCCGIH